MNCPKCKTEKMETFDIEGVQFDFCCGQNGCLGLWCEKGELALYTESGKDFPFKTLEVGKADFNCPTCNSQPLYIMRYEEDNELELDHCKECEGIFIDKFELRKIEKAIIKIPLKERLTFMKNELSKKGFNNWSKKNEI